MMKYKKQLIALVLILLMGLLPACGLNWSWNPAPKATATPEAVQTAKPRPTLNQTKSNTPTPQPQGPRPWEGTDYLVLMGAPLSDLTFLPGWTPESQQFGGPQGFYVDSTSPPNGSYTIAIADTVGCRVLLYDAAPVYPEDYTVGADIQHEIVASYPLDAGTAGQPKPCSPTDVMIEGSLLYALCAPDQDGIQRLFTLGMDSDFSSHVKLPRVFAQVEVVNGTPYLFDAEQGLWFALNIQKGTVTRSVVRFPLRFVSPLYPANFKATANIHPIANAFCIGKSNEVYEMTVLNDGLRIRCFINESGGQYEMPE